MLATMFTLLSAVLPREDAIIANVIVSNDAAYLWLFENAATAHQNYNLTTPTAKAIAGASPAR